MKRTALKRKTPLKRGPWRRKPKLKRITRDRLLTIDEGARLQKVREQIKEEFLPQRQPTILQRRTWMKRESDKRKADRVIYNARRKAFLHEHPWCELMVTCGALTIKRDLPGVAQIPLRRQSKQLHHKRGRGKWYLDERYWLAACRDCHAYEDTHRNEAMKLGLRERVYEKH